VGAWTTGCVPSRVLEHQGEAWLEECCHILELVGCRSCVIVLGLLPAWATAQNVEALAVVLFEQIWADEGTLVDAAG